ncbi:efflux RND transporter periplasmic adaptor subunit [Jiulongibacter sediminis]|uniref:RND transporter n=1 Tax=Jiulongibacter sediminis TaxID=1605367 RepID=A0A0P7BUL6_9BACT|nr:efflux RND transporter periplasmic adaptor subunit [Jiulongibacter sediminis]KPM48493.1 RND transporter [Jiulongibacter sediminis]TBX25031.1 RND transporter [Jiulongibacter sediminis]
MKKTIYLLALLTLGCGQEEKAEQVTQQEETTAVTLTKPVLKSFSDEITGSGVLSSKAELKLAFKTGGLIKRMYVNEGQYVKAGQLLAELDMSEIEAGVNQAKLGFEKAERDLEKVKGLYEDELVTKSNLQDATTAYDVAKEQLSAATYNQKLSRIYAPQAGKVLMKIAEQGELITPFAPALILGTGTSSFNVNIGLADKDIVKLKTGDKAMVSLDAYSGADFPAKISQIAQTVNPSTGTYEVELSLDSQGKKLISGFVAKATIYPSSEKSGLFLPLAAVVGADGSSASVFLLQGKQVEKRPVKLGELQGEQVQITAGLSENDQVVLRGANFLSDGETVNIAKP